MDYLVGQHAEERAWSDMLSSPLLGRKCKSKITSWSFSGLVCILITLAQRSTRIVMYVALKAVGQSGTSKASATVPRSVRPNKLTSNADLKMLKEVSENP